MPGMINVHTHASMIQFRSLGDDCKDHLRRFLFPLENECMIAELVYHSARYAVAEMLLSGVTTMMDMYYFEDEVAKAADEIGIRAYIVLEYGESFIKKWKYTRYIHSV